VMNGVGMGRPPARDAEISSSANLPHLHNRGRRQPRGGTRPVLEHCRVEAVARHADDEIPRPGIGVGGREPTDRDTGRDQDRCQDVPSAGVATDREPSTCFACARERSNTAARRLACAASLAFAIICTVATASRIFVSQKIRSAEPRSRV
jgi:hypothetical protein